MNTTIFLLAGMLATSAHAQETCKFNKWVELIYGIEMDIAEADADGRKLPNINQEDENPRQVSADTDAAVSRSQASAIQTRLLAKDF